MRSRIAALLAVTLIPIGCADASKDPTSSVALPVFDGRNGDDRDSDGNEHRRNALTAVILTGAKERPGPGDPDALGSAIFTFNQRSGEVCYTLVVVRTSQEFTGAHIHKASRDLPGPIVIPLTTPTAGSSTGCLVADRALVKDIRKQPGNYYVNVHTVEFRPGAVRAQLDERSSLP